MDALTHIIIYRFDEIEASVAMKSVDVFDALNLISQHKSENGRSGRVS